MNIAAETQRLIPQSEHELFMSLTASPSQVQQSNANAYDTWLAWARNPQLPQQNRINAASCAMASARTSEEHQYAIQLHYQLSAIQ